MTVYHDSNSPLRLALYGGAFDPVHNGHLHVARSARLSLDLDQVIFIPAAQSPLKAAGPQVSAEDRLEMLRLAIQEDLDAFSIDTCEIERGGLSYSFETVQGFRERFPQAALHWILGADQFSQLADWRHADKLAGLVTFLVLPRSGYGLRAPDIDQIQYKLIDAPMVDLSSSQIRECLLGDLELSDWLPPTVEAFIRRHKLYI